MKKLSKIILIFISLFVLSSNSMNNFRNGFSRTKGGLDVLLKYMNYAKGKTETNLGMPSQPQLLRLTYPKLIKTKKPSSENNIFKFESEEKKIKETKNIKAEDGIDPLQSGLGEVKESINAWKSSNFQERIIHANRIFKQTVLGFRLLLITGISSAAVYNSLKGDRFDDACKIVSDFFQAESDLKFHRPYVVKKTKGGFGSVGITGGGILLLPEDDHFRLKALLESRLELMLKLDRLKDPTNAESELIKDNIEVLKNLQKAFEFGAPCDIYDNLKLRDFIKALLRYELMPGENINHSKFIHILEDISRESDHNISDKQKLIEEEKIEVVNILKEIEKRLDMYRAIHDHEIFGHLNHFHQFVQWPVLIGSFIAMDFAWRILRSKLESNFLKGDEVSRLRWLKRATLRLFIPTCAYLIIFRLSRALAFQSFEMYADSCVRDDYDVLKAAENHFRGLVDRDYLLFDVLVSTHPTNRSRANYFASRIARLEKASKDALN